MHSDESVSPHISDPALSFIETTDVAYRYTTDHIHLLGYRSSAFAKRNEAKQITNCQLRNFSVFMALKLRHIKMSLFVFFISLLIVAQHVSGNHVPIIRS